MISGDIAASAAKALLASRTNVLFSGPMLFGMLASKHGAFSVSSGGMEALSFTDFGFIITLLIVIALEVNAVIGQLRQLATIAGVVHLSLILTAVIYLILHFL